LLVRRFNASSTVFFQRKAQSGKRLQQNKTILAVTDGEPGRSQRSDENDYSFAVPDRDEELAIFHSSRECAGSCFIDDELQSVRLNDIVDTLSRWVERMGPTEWLLVECNTD